MFKKLEINNIGRFKASKTDGNEQFLKKNTFIYGKNTYGKSTLTAIFRSLKENNPSLVVGRKTIGTDKQAIKIIPDVNTPIGEYRYTTDENKWSAEFKDIIIFDNRFVRESVYTQNQQIGKEQQKNIETFMLGTKGVEYNLKIDELVGQIAENTKVQISTSTDYSRNKHLFGGLDFDIFLGLTEVIDVDKKIDEEERELDRIKNSEIISSKLTEIKIMLEEYVNLDAIGISERLSINSDLISKHFTDHINQKETKQTYSMFLQTGSKLRTHGKDELCPFCTQEIKTDSVKEFLNTIDIIYNEKYRNIQKAIKDAESKFASKSFSSGVQKLKVDLQQAGYILGVDFSDLDNLFNNCKKSITDKKDNLSSEFDSIPFTGISAKANDYISAIETELIKFKNPAERKTELENSLKKLKANKERYGAWKEKCECYIKAKKDNEELGVKKDAVWDEYLVYANGLSTTMLSDINSVLNACNCNFAVQTFNFKGNQRQDLFALSMGGNLISNDGEDCKMTVKNCLSDSDKWVLALAFFLATIKNDASIKIVLMDDPVSSFDSDRKRIILKEISRVLIDTDKQLILLTHEKGFYQLLHAENNNDASSAFLRISLDAQNGSDLTVCNPDEDEDFLSDYNCWINCMKNALNSNNISIVKNAHSNIRFVIEHILKAKYPLELTKEHCTIEKMLSKLEDAGGPYVTISPRADIKNVLTNLDHHDNSGIGQYPIRELGIDDYKKDIRDTFQIIKKL